MIISMSEPRLPKVEMNLVRPKDPVVGRVVSNELCLNGKSSSFVKHLVLDVSNTKLAGSFCYLQTIRGINLDKFCIWVL